MKKKLKLSNGLFIFENDKDFKHFWNEVINNEYEHREIIGNTFIVMKNNWLSKLIKWLAKKL